MVALLIGILLIAFAVYAFLPFDFPMALNWYNDVIQFLKGGAPILALLVGLIAFFIGIADIKDKMEEKREAKESTDKTEKSEEKA
ncbi:MAG: hypothetical protein JW969_16980 [Spirochaetales bacterium]|nr:hypothetical protein [Spirochaetales bacterium]